LGSADYTWRPCYQVLKQYEKEVQDGSKDHVLMAWEWLDFAAKWRKQKYGINEKNLKSMESGMIKDKAQRIMHARWMNDSSGYYMLSEVDACRVA
jgi:hypothetical protein